MTEPDSSKVLGEPQKTWAEVRGLVRRVQSELHFGVEYVVTKEGLEVKTKGLKAELTAHANITFRWTSGILFLGVGQYWQSETHLSCPAQMRVLRCNSAM